MSSFGALPLNLAFVGMPGCTGHVSGDAVGLLVGAADQQAPAEVRVESLAAPT